LSDALVYPSKDGSEYIELIQEHRGEDVPECDDFSARVDLVNIRDTKTGAIKSSFERLRGIAGPKLSPDGQTIAAFSRDLTTCEKNIVFFTLFTRDGKQILLGKSDLHSFDWLPDNRLGFIVKKDDDQYFLGVQDDKDVYKYRSVALLRTEGEPGGIRVSPDGKRVLFTDETGRNPFLSGVKFVESTVYSINIDGTDLTKLITTSRNEQPRINNPLWSPDGSAILVTENYSSGVNTTFYGYDEVSTVVTDVSVIPVLPRSVSYSVSSDIDRLVALPPDRYSESIRPLLTVQDGVLSAVVLNPLTALAWTPSQN